MVGNRDEPDFATPYLYNYLDKQAKSVQQSRALANQYFGNRVDGLPGNSDAGAINSWLVWQMIGLYPIATQPVYLLVSPWFEYINVTVNHDKQLRIMTTGLDDGDSRSGYFVLGVKINGIDWDKNWFEHTDMDIMSSGGTLEFDLGKDMAAWESGSPPPSPGNVRA